VTQHTLACMAATALLRKQPAESMWDIGNQRFTATGWRAIKSTGDFYRSFGCNYRAIDVNSNMEADIADLNHPLEGPRFPPRDLVVNNGTSEHIFNQAQLFRTIHELSKNCMLHILPFTPWINHGFFNYNPILFRDLAAANHYAFEFFWIGGRDGRYVEIAPGSLHAFDGKQAASLLKEVRNQIGEQEAFLVVALRKTEDTPFRAPIQGRYLADIESTGMRIAYET